MSTKKKVKQRDNYQCQICGDFKGKMYFTGICVETEAHHIIPKSKGGLIEPDNFITLCDLCHVVLHSEKWTYQFGDKGAPENMEEIKKEFEDCIRYLNRERKRSKPPLLKLQN